MSSTFLTLATLGATDAPYPTLGVLGAGTVFHFTTSARLYIAVGTPGTPAIQHEGGTYYGVRQYVGLWNGVLYMAPQSRQVVAVPVGTHLVVTSGGAPHDRAR